MGENAVDSDADQRRKCFSDQRLARRAGPADSKLKLRHRRGAACLHAERRFGGIWVGHKHVKRLMRQRQLSGLVRRRRVRTTIRVPRVRVAKELVGRDFTAPTPNRLWVADISYGRTWAGTRLVHRLGDQPDARAWYLAVGAAVGA